MAKWLQERMVAQVRTEQVIDEWVKKTPAGKVIQGVLDVAWHEGRKEPVSYTHLTLPTICSV
eukprot:7183565-Prorocentrum_lima.AAC.1